MDDEHVAAETERAPIGLSLRWMEQKLVIDVPAVATELLEGISAETPVFLRTAHVPRGIPYQVTLVIKTPNLRFFLRPWPAPDGTLSLAAQWNERLGRVWRGDTLLARILFVTPRGNREFFARLRRGEISPRATDP